MYFVSPPISQTLPNVPSPCDRDFDQFPKLTPREGERRQRDGGNQAISSFSWGINRGSERRSSTSVEARTRHGGPAEEKPQDQFAVHWDEDRAGDGARQVASSARCQGRNGVHERHDSAVENARFAAGTRERCLTEECELQQTPTIQHTQSLYLTSPRCCILIFLC